MILTVFSILVLTGIHGCAHQEYIEPLPCPIAPELVGIPPEDQVLIAPETLGVIVNNMVALMQYAERLEARLGCN